MIPFSTCLCFGKYSFSTWHVVGNNATLKPAGSTLNHAERRGGISYEKADKDAVYIRMLGDSKIRSKRKDCGSEERNSLELDLNDIEGAISGRGRIGLKFLSLHKVRRKRRPALRFSHAYESLLDEHYDRQAKFVLTNVGDWNFDMFNLDTLTGGKPLFHLALHLFQEYGFLDYFNLDIMKLMRCLNLVEEGYHENNPYHNVIHAADVTQAMHCYLKEQKLSCSIHPMEAMAALFASMMHDLYHPGVNQAYLIATTNILASLYDNSSVLENHHWRSAIGILHESGLFDHFDAHQWGHLEWQLKSLILATDITRQQEFIRRFKEYLDSSDFNINNNASHRHFALQIALKCADISNPCRPWKSSKRWSERICEEFFLQGDCERKLKLPITPMCDRYTTSIAKIQSGFMEYVVNPLFQEWLRFIPSVLSKNMLKNVLSNKNRWDNERANELKREAELNNEEQNSDSLSSVFELDETNLANYDGNFQTKEEEDDEYNSGSEEADIIGETRFMCMVPSRHGSLEYSESLRSNSPVSENRENFIPGTRRHSLPLSCFRRESMRITVRRESFPHMHKSRRSLPRTNFHYTTSFDGFFSTNSKSISIESVLTRPKITTLSPSSDASRLASRLVFSDPHLAQRSNSIPSTQKSSSRLMSLLALTAISPSAEIDYPLQAFQSRTVLAPLSSNTQVGSTSREIWQTRDAALNPLRRVPAIDLTFQIKGQALGAHGELSQSGGNRLLPDNSRTDLIPVSSSEPLRLSEHSRRRLSDEESL